MEPSDFPTRETVYAKIRADLDQYGWSLISSIYRDELFTHTVGLSWSYEHQEIELIGLNSESNSTEEKKQKSLFDRLFKKKNE